MDTYLDRLLILRNLPICFTRTSSPQKEEYHQYHHCIVLGSLLTRVQHWQMLVARSSARLTARQQECKSRTCARASCAQSPGTTHRQVSR